MKIHLADFFRGTFKTLCKRPDKFWISLEWRWLNLPNNEAFIMPLLYLSMLTNYLFFLTKHFTYYLLLFKLPAFSFSHFRVSSTPSNHNFVSICLLLDLSLLFHIFVLQCSLHSCSFLFKFCWVLQRYYNS